MSLTTTQLDALIELARAALQSALDNPKPNYTLNNRTVYYGDYIKGLQETLDNLGGMQANIPSEQTRDFDSHISDTGEDNTNYEGDSDI